MKYVSIYIRRKFQEKIRCFEGEIQKKLLVLNSAALSGTLEVQLLAKNTRFIYSVPLGSKEYYSQDTDKYKLSN